MLVEAAQERVRVGLPPERYEREDRLQAPRRSGDQRRTDKRPGIGWPVNKNIQWQVRSNERGQGSPSGYRIAVVLFLAHVCSHCPAPHPPAGDRRSRSELPEPRGCVESHGRPRLSPGRTGVGDRPTEAGTLAAVPYLCAP